MIRDPLNEDGQRSAHPVALPRQPRSTLVRNVLDAQQRERIFVLQEVLKVRGLMPADEAAQRPQMDSRRAPRIDRNHARAVEPLALSLHAGPARFHADLLPLLAWWLDRRRGQRGH